MKKRKNRYTYSRVEVMFLAATFFLISWRAFLFCKVTPWHNKLFGHKVFRQHTLPGRGALSAYPKDLYICMLERRVGAKRPLCSIRRTPRMLKPSALRFPISDIRFPSLDFSPQPSDFRTRTSVGPWTSALSPRQVSAPHSLGE